MMKGIIAPLKSWWEGQRDRHLFILGTISFLAFSVVMWSIIYFFFLDGTKDPDLDHLTDGTWAGLFIGFTVLIFVGLAALFMVWTVGHSLLLEDVYNRFWI